jgi:hypothetical protein
MRYELDPPRGVDPVPVRVGMATDEAAAALEQFFGVPPQRITIYRGEGWMVPTQDEHSAGLIFFDDGGPTIGWIEVSSGATYFDETIEVAGSDQVLWQGVELFNANSSEVLERLRSQGVDFVDVSEIGALLVVPGMGLQLTRESARRTPDDDPAEYPDTPWATATIFESGG